MKASKILAGLSAAAIAGSMLTLVAGAMEFDKTLSAGVSFQNNTQKGTFDEWGDTSASITDFEIGKEFTITFDAGDKTFVPANYFAIETGIPQETQDPETEAQDYSFTISSIKGDGKELAYDASGLDVHFENNFLRAELYKSPDWGGKATAVDTSTWDPISTLEITLTIDKDGDVSDIVPFKAPDGAIFFNKGWDITAANPADDMAVSEDWMNDGFQFQVAKDGFKADLSNAVVSIVVQSDVAYDKDAVVFKYIDLRDFPDGDLNFFSNGDEKDNVYKVDIPWTKFVDLVNVGTNGAGLWIDENTGDVNGGQIMIQTMQVKADEKKGLPARNINLWAYIDGVTYTEDVEKPSDSVDFEIGEGISFNKPYLFDPTDDLDEDNEYTSAKFKLNGLYPSTRGDEKEPAWNDYCVYKVKITDKDGNVSWRVVQGKKVSWDITVDDGGTPGDTEADKADDTIIPQGDPRIIVAGDTLYDDDGAITGGGDVELNIPFAYGTTVEFIAMGWSDDEVEGYGDVPYIYLDTASIGFEKIDEPTPVDPTPVDPTPVTPLPGPGTESEPLDSNSSGSPTNNGGSTNSNTSSGSTSSAAAGKSGDSNPATGAAALGTVGVLLAGAAMAVSKKRK